MPGRWRKMVIGIAVLVLAACQQQETVVLPTVMDLGAIQTGTAQALTPLPTATRPGPTLPPTWTPTLPPSPTPTTPTATFTPTETVIETPTRIFYIFNNDSILSLNPTGTGTEEIIVNIGPGLPITDLTYSPVSKLLAFVAPGNGSAREVFVSTLDGTYLQQVSCLGFGSVHKPVWSADGQRIAFYAAPTEGQNPGVYEAGWVGGCPQGNNQRQLVLLQDNRMGGLAYAGNYLYFSNSGTYALDLAQNQLIGPILEPSGYGPNSEFAVNPFIINVMAYLYRSATPLAGRTTGSTQVARLDIPTQTYTTEASIETTAQDLQWNADGTLLMVSSNNSAIAHNLNNAVDSITVILGSDFPPQAVFSPDGTQAAYIDSDPNNAALAQIYTTSLTDSDPIQQTFHAEGSITDLIWANLEG